MPTRPLLLAASGLILALGIGAGYGLYALSAELKETRARFIETEASYSQKVATLEEALQKEQGSHEETRNGLLAEQEKVEDYEDRVDSLKEEVDTLEKIVETDEELLLKYSKVFFLNENYTPSKLKLVDPTYLLQPERAFEIHADVEPYLMKLMDAAHEDDIDLKIASAYRSFGTQATLKNSYRVQYGSGANAFSADQGYSEHQLGTTVDFTTTAIGGTLSGFSRTEAYEWLLTHAWRYGFVLSYPEGNSYYVYEPWHWRFVGKDLAEYLHEEELNFYDLDQREINEYLGSIFE